MISKQDLSPLFNVIKRVLSTIRNLPIVNTRDEEMAVHANYVLAFESFVVVVVDVMARHSIACSTDQTAFWSSYLADTIKYHVYGECVTVPKISCGQYALRMGESSRSVIQRCFDLIHLLLVRSGRMNSLSCDPWESLFSSKGFGATDAYFFLKYFGLNTTLYQSFENIAAKVKNGTGIVLL